MSAEAHTSTEYIKHHLQNLTFGQLPAGYQRGDGETLSVGTWTLAHTAKEAKDMGFMAINVDTMGFSVLLGALFLFFFHRASVLATKSAANVVPGGWVNFVEWVVEFVDSSVKGSFTSRNPMVAPLALTIFIWIFLMNAMDMLPVDALPALWHGVGPAMGYMNYMRVVPTADLSTTLGMSVSVLLVCIFYSIKIKGLGGWTHELVAAPFGDNIFLYPINFLMQMIEFAAKTVSHGMRLFGNMFAGELIFMLIALMGGAWAWQLNPLSGGFWLGFGQVFAGTVWTLFHILVITLQAFIFMMLTLIYVGQAHSSH